MNPHTTRMLGCAWTSELLERANEAGRRMPSVVRGMPLPAPPEPPAYKPPVVMDSTYQEYYAS